MSTAATKGPYSRSYALILLLVVRFQFARREFSVFEFGVFQ